jgi:hypothetical protein
MGSKWKERKWEKFEGIFFKKSQVPALSPQLV